MRKLSEVLQIVIAELELRSRSVLVAMDNCRAAGDITSEEYVVMERDFSERFLSGGRTLTFASTTTRKLWLRKWIVDLQRVGK